MQQRSLHNLGMTTVFVNVTELCIENFCIKESHWRLKYSVKIHVSLCYNLSRVRIKIVLSNKGSKGIEVYKQKMFIIQAI